MKSRKAAAIWAFFLGGGGAHHFYLGNVGRGIFYFLFCWTFIPPFIAIIEFFIFLTMSDAVFNEKYNSKHVAMDNIDKLEKLHNLKEKGIISSEEFDSQKKKLMI